MGGGGSGRESRFGPQDIRTYQIVPRKDKFTVDSLPEVLALVYVDPWAESQKGQVNRDERGFGVIQFVVMPGGEDFWLWLDNFMK